MCQRVEPNTARLASDKAMAVPIAQASARHCRAAIKASGTSSQSCGL
jgi:hypothetical protein